MLATCLKSGRVVLLTYVQGRCFIGMELPKRGRAGFWCREERGGSCSGKKLKRKRSQILSFLPHPSNPKNRTHPGTEDLPPPATIFGGVFFTISLAVAILLFWEGGPGGGGGLRG